MYIRTSEGLAQGPLPYGLGAWTPSTLPAGMNGKLYKFESKNGGSTTAVYVPAVARGTNPVGLLVWIHGDLICGDKGKDAVDYVKSETFPLAKQLADSKLPFVLVAPSMKWQGQHWHPLGSPKTMNAFLEEVCTGLTHAGWSSVPTVGRLILAGHSRAYAVFNWLAQAMTKDGEWKKGALATLTDVWLLDTTYSVKDNKDAICNDWLKWAQAQVQAKRDVNLRIFYLRDTGTAALAECIRDKAKMAGLKNVIVQGFSWQQLLREHCGMPRDRMPALLAASVQAPRVPSRFRTVADEPAWIDTLRRRPMHAR